MKRIVIASFISVFSLVSILAFSADNIEKVEKNMQETEVFNILGKPSTILEEPSEGNDIVKVWKYGSDTEISFVNGKVSLIRSFANTDK